MRHADYIRLGGTKARRKSCGSRCAARSRRARGKIHQNYYLPMTTAMAVALF